MGVLFSIAAHGQFFELTPAGMINKADPTKSYVVLEFPGKKQQELFVAAKNFLVTSFNSGKEVMTVSEPDVISALATMIFPFKHGMNYEAFLKYKYSLTFREGKIKVDCLIVDTGLTDFRPKWALSLVRQGMTVDGIFTKKGDVVSERSVIAIEGQINALNLGLSNAIYGANTPEEW